jgi:hypothetical protein
MSSSLNLGAAFGVENGTPYRLSMAIGQAFSGQHVIEINEVFDLEEYAGSAECEITRRASPHAEVRSEWGRSHGLRDSVRVGVFDVKWRGGGDRSFVVAHATWPEMYQTKHCWYVVSDDRKLAEEFVDAACNYCNEPRNTVLTFRGGCWSKDREMYRAIQSSSFDDLILANDMGREIQEDFGSFMTAKEQYARYGVPWKRGVLFLGPPGNGKTHCLRATIKMLNVPCLYVQSLKHRYTTDDENIERVFHRAREVTPCCLVFEDLDAMITNDNRSVFLNQLDGFANASGMLTLATTNHPDKLDPAIVERPSRFDRKYHFALPNDVERGRYITRWRERLDQTMRISEQETEKLVVETDGFSFAYLKELFLSAMIRWIKTRAEGAMFGILSSQLVLLREQMRTEPSPTPEVREKENEK